MVDLARLIGQYRSTSDESDDPMTIEAKPQAEVTIDPSLARALLREQHTDLADFALIEVGEGWDNKLFRLGNDLAVRVPRRAASAARSNGSSGGFPKSLRDCLCQCPRRFASVVRALHSHGRGPSYLGSPARVRSSRHRRTLRQRLPLWNDFLARSTSRHREMLDTTRGGVSPLRLAQRKDRNTSDGSRGSWTALPY